MNKIIASIAVLAVVGGGIYWFTTRDKNQNSQQNQNEQTNQTQNENSNAPTPGPSSTKTSTNLKDLANGGNPQKCTFATTKDGFEVTGTSYLNGQGKYRVDFTSKDNGQTTTGHNIFDANAMVYFWIDGQTQGFKYDLVSYETAGQGAVDPNADTEYDCTSWSVDNSMFTPPSSVEFVSFADLMNEQR
jgi:hypothetical protein